MKSKIVFVALLAIFSGCAQTTRSPDAARQPSGGVTRYLQVLVERAPADNVLKSQDPVFMIDCLLIEVQGGDVDSRRPEAYANLSDWRRASYEPGAVTTTVGLTIGARLGEEGVLCASAVGDVYSRGPETHVDLSGWLRAVRALYESGAVTTVNGHSIGGMLGEEGALCVSAEGEPSRRCLVQTGSQTWVVGTAISDAWLTRPRVVEFDAATGQGAVDVDFLMQEDGFIRFHVLEERVPFRLDEPLLFSQTEGPLPGVLGPTVRRSWSVQ